MFLETIRRSRSKSFATLVAIFCFGVFLGPSVLWMPMLLFVGMVCVLLIVFACLPNSTFRFVVLMSLVLCLGMFRYTQSEIPPGVQSVGAFVNRSIRVEGTIASEVDVQARTQTATLRDVSVADAPTFGRVLVRAATEPTLQYGDHIAFSCSMRKPEPFNGFAYDRYLASKQIYAICDQPQFIDVISSHSSIVKSVLSIKQFLNTQLDQLLPEPHSTFVSGLLFGGNSGLSQNIKTDFARTGTSHILAASGFNVSLFTFVFFGWVMETRLGRKRGAILTAILVVLYVIMAGAQAAVVRAALLSSVLLLETFVRRKASVTNALLLAAAVILLFNPRLLRDDVGFQLSFVAMIAILYLAPKWESFVAFIPKTLGLREAFVGSLSVLFVSLPVLLWNFGSLSLIAPIANVFILPLVPMLMMLTCITLFVSMISLPIAQLFALPIWAGSRFILEINAIFSSMSIASVSIAYAHTIAVVTLILLIVFFLFLYEPARRAILKTIRHET